ncbi:MAG: hypothetical protein U1F27_05460 [Turneriella sp.]
MKNKSLLMFVFAFSAMAMASCGEKGPLTVQSVVLSTTEGGAGAKVFPATEHKIFVKAQLNRMQSNLTGKLVWTAVDTTAGKNIEVYSLDLNSAMANVIDGNVSLPKDWPTGSYKLDIYLMGALAKTETFTIE